MSPNAHQQAAAEAKCYEDSDDGFRFDFEVPGLTREEIIAFAEQYDPQRFHLDETAAQQTHFGGLIASGFQTQLLCFQPFCRQVLNHSHAVGAPGIDELKWLRPWYPLQDLVGEVRLLSRRRSSSGKDRGYLEFQLVARTGDRPVLEMRWSVIMLTRDGVNKING